MKYLSIFCFLLFSSISAAQYAEPEPPPKGLDNFALCQPAVHYRGHDEPAGQGKGFLAEMPWGDILGISVAHYIRPDGPPVNKIEYLDIETGEIRASFNRSYGYPGRIEEMTTSNGREDIMMLGPTRRPGGKRLFQFDRKPYTEYLNAPVWLIYHYPPMEGGYIVIPGEIKRLYEDGFGVKFQNTFNTNGYSGSPLVHAGTGKVMGVMRARTADKEFGSLTTFVPSQFILERNGKDPDRPSLSRAWRKRKEEPRPETSGILAPLNGEGSADEAALRQEKLVREFDGAASSSAPREEPTLSFGDSDAPASGSESGERKSDAGSPNSDSADSSDGDSDSDASDDGVVIDFGD